MNRVKILLKLADTFHRALDKIDRNGAEHDEGGLFTGKRIGGSVGSGSLNRKTIEKKAGNVNNGGQFREKDYNKNEENTSPKKKLSASGKNRISVRGFGSSDDLKRHIDKHLSKEKAFAGMSAEEYIAEGLKLLESPVGNGIEGHMDSLGNIVRYDRVRNLIAIGDDGGLFTFYSPQKGHEKYLNLRREALKYGGTT